MDKASGFAPSERSWTEASRANRVLWPWAIGILALELLLARVLPSRDFAGFAPVNAAVDALARIAPVIHNFDPVAPHPAGLALYFALGVLLVPAKAVLVHCWLNSSRIAMYRHFVISPLTPAIPASANDFVREPVRDGPAGEAPRSLGSRIRWSLAILLFTVAGLVLLVQLGWEIPANQPGDRRHELARLAGGGFALWVKWSLLWTSYGALLFAILVNVLRDWGRFLQARFANEGPAP